MAFGSRVGIDYYAALDIETVRNPAAASLIRPPEDRYTARVAELEAEIGKPAPHFIKDEILAAQYQRDRDLEIQKDIGRAIETAENEYRADIEKMALDPNLGMVCAFAMVWKDKHQLDHIRGLDGNEERDLLIQIFEALDATKCIVTFNGMNFDLPFLYTRALYCCVKPTRPLDHYSKRYTRLPHYDLMQVLSNWGSLKRRSLDFYIQQILQEPEGKEELPYSQFVDVIQRGQGHMIAEGCLQHTQKTFELFHEVARIF